MSRSNAPLALSVVSLTQPGDVQSTFERIAAFDDAKFGFTHDRTWNALPNALRGSLDPEAVHRSFAGSKIHPRIQRCIVALCRLGQGRPRVALRFADFPESGLKPVQSIDWDPEVRVRVKATCWYVMNGQVVIPILQPRKEPLNVEQLAVYVWLVRQAYCQGDWLGGLVNLIDLSGAGDTVMAREIDLSSLPSVSEKRISEYVQTFVEAKRLVDVVRTKVKKTSELPLDHLLGSETN